MPLIVILVSKWSVTFQRFGPGCWCLYVCVSCWSNPLLTRPDSPLSLLLYPLWSLWDSCSAERSLWKQAVILLARGRGGQCGLSVTGLFTACYSEALHKTSIKGKAVYQEGNIKLIWACWCSMVRLFAQQLIRLQHKHFPLSLHPSSALSGVHSWQRAVQEESSPGKHPGGSLQLHRGESSHSHMIY